MKCKQKYCISISEASEYECIELGFKHIRHNQRMDKGDLYYERCTREGINKKSIKYRYQIYQIHHRIYEHHKLFYEGIFHMGINKRKRGIYYEN